MEELIKKSDARRAVLHECPAAAYCIDNIKPVDAVEVVHGRWIGQRCSVCNESYMDYADADSYPAIGEPKPNYCPNCGAKMDLEGYNEFS